MKYGDFGDALYAKKQMLPNPMSEQLLPREMAEIFVTNGQRQKTVEQTVTPSKTYDHFDDDHKNDNAPPVMSMLCFAKAS